MQKSSRNLFKTFVFYLLICLGGSLNASNLNQADSLFDAHKYTEAFTIYDSIYSVADLQAPSMLLKMAFIKEGLDDYVNAIFYLNKYYDLTHDASAVDKIRTLAETHQLKGYKYNDLRFVEKQIARVKPIAQWSFLVLGLFSIAYLFLSKLKSQPFSTKAFIFAIVFSILSLSFNLIGGWQARGILEAESLAFDAPSAGANVLETLNKGDQVQIINEIDIWLHIQASGKDLYVKKHLVKKI